MGKMTRKHRLAIDRSKKAKNIVGKRSRYKTWVIDMEKKKLKLSKINKDLYTKQSILYKKEVLSDGDMNKRGIFIEIGALILIAITTLGVAITVSSTTSLYVGDTNTGYFLDYYKCTEQAKQINQENLIVFPSKSEAINQRYNETEGCV
jgi:hypothetical protein